MNKNNRLSDEESSLSMSIMRQSVESVQHLPIRNPLTKTLAISLTTIGSFSEGAQSLFGLSQAFGMDNVFASLASRQGPFTLLKLSYILFGSVMTAIQSFCLEYPYTFDLFDDPLNLFRQHPDAAVHLSVTELSILTAITFLGASVRGVVSIMGYYALSDDIHVALKTVIYLSAFFEISQTIATDGTYLQKAYLWLRSDKQDDEQQTAIRVEYGHDAGENPACETWDSLAVYISCLLLASLSVLGETGLGFIALQQCASQNDFDPQSTGFLVLAALSLSGYFLMMSAIDSASPANMITLWYEQQGRVSFPTTTETLSIPVTCAQRIHYSVALFISMNGAIIKALGAYSGMSFLLTQWHSDSTAILGISIAVGLIRAWQCYAVEGVATLAAADSLFRENTATMLPPTSAAIKHPVCCASFCATAFGHASVSSNHYTSVDSSGLLRTARGQLSHSADQWA